MPLPFLVGAVAAKVVLGAAVATGVVGTAKGVKGVVDSNKANSVQNEAEEILSRAKSNLEIKKSRATKQIRELGKIKLNLASNEIRRFVDAYSKLKNVELSESIGLQELNKLRIDKNDLREMKDVALSASSVVGGGLAGVGAGALLGWGTYGGVMALGSASTGTAIASISGVAATNATLAWLGGGSLAVGGGGMALGTAVLGGLVAGPALLIAGGVFGAKSKEKLNNAYSNLSEAKKIREELNTAGVELDVVASRAKQLGSLASSIKIRFGQVIEVVERTVEYNNNWRSMTMSEKQAVAMAVKYAQAAKVLLDVPLLNDDGSLTFKSKEILSNSNILALR